MDAERSTGETYGFWLLWGKFKEYIKYHYIISMAVLRKVNSYSVAIFSLIKKDQQFKTIPKEKN